MTIPFEPYELVVAVYPEKDAAAKILKEIRKEAKKEKFHLENSSILVKTEEGKFKIYEREDVHTTRGAIFGGIVGGVIGLVGGPIGVVIGAAAGAATGGVTARNLDMGFSDKQLNALKDAMVPGSSAVLVMFERSGDDEVIEIMESLEGKIFRQMLPADIVKQLVNEQQSGQTNHT